MKSLRKMTEHIRHDDQPCELEYVGFWPRTLAGVIDVGLLAALLFPLLRVAERGPEVLVTGGTPMLLALLLCAAAALLFYMAPGTTPGMLAISAVVLDERTSCPPKLVQHLGRSLALILSLVPFGLGFLWVAFHPKKQGWHDKLAGTIVVRGRAGTQRLSAGQMGFGQHDPASATRR